MITTDTIISTLKSWVENKQNFSPDTYVDAAAKLNVLIGDEHDKLFELQQTVANLKVDRLEQGETVSKPKEIITRTIPVLGQTFTEKLF